VPTTPRLIVVADDLTGAADCGAVCAAAGLETIVALGDAARARGLSADVVAFDAETRHLASQAAAAATRDAIRALCTRDVRVLYKKIDSTLRGNFAVEIAAARTAWSGSAGPALAVVAPASATTGRTTRDGRMYLRGVPLEESEIWRNEGMHGVANLPAMLRESAGLRTELIGLETVRAGAEPLTAALAGHAAHGVDAVACDAETDDDLRALAFAASRLTTPVLLAGSAGLMRHVPAAYDLAKATIPNRTETISIRATAARHSPLLFVVGSRSSVSREQLRLLAEEKGMRSFELAPAMLLGGAGSDAWQENARLIDAAWREDRDVAVTIGLGTQVDLRESGPLSQALGAFLQPWLERVGGIFCTGGDTAKALLAAAGAVGIRLIGEVEPGVACGTVEGARPLPVVLKPGAFGSPQALVRSRAVLHRLAAAQASPGP
jgi:uncharacterized protein YgbK (DUF1537 family)